MFSPKLIFCLYHSSYRMAAELNALKTTLGRVGFSVDARDAITDPAVQGISYKATLVSLDDDDDATTICNAI